ncbi:CpaF family protein [Leucobacter luti]|nr:ATPase, T2SS/T4P/T4SS family [Leucobacter luti]
MIPSLLRHTAPAQPKTVVRSPGGPGGFGGSRGSRNSRGSAESRRSGGAGGSRRADDFRGAVERQQRGKHGRWWAGRESSPGQADTARQDEIAPERDVSGAELRATEASWAELLGRATPQSDGPQAVGLLRPDPLPDNAAERSSRVCAPLPPPRTAALPLAARRALGGLLPVLDDPALRDLLVHVRAGQGELWVDRAGQIEHIAGWSVQPAAVHRLATALIAAGGRHLDELHPSGDVRLGDGMRVHAVLPPVAVAGAAVSIRVPRVEMLSFDELVSGGLCTLRVADLLRSAVRGRRNLLITGGTGTGKTTLLAALLSLVGRRERIVTIEDLAELRLAHPHAIALEARQASTEGLGRVTLDELLREALRMRPDRIALGECRGPEIATLLTALNTGHDGGAGTLHASKISEVPARLEALGASAGLPPEALARQAVSALDLVVHLTRVAGRPRVEAIGRLSIGTDRGLAIDVGRL